MKTINFNELLATRLDKFLVNELEDLTRTKIKKLITNGKIKVNNNIVTKAGFNIEGTGVIAIEPFEEKKTLVPWHSSNLLDVVKETEDYIIVNKPSSLSVHPGAGNVTKTLANILIAERDLLSGDDTRPGIVHRLDKNTSGLLVISKNDKFHKYMSKQFETRQVEKTYIGLVQGKMPSTKGMIDAPIARDNINKTKMNVSSKGGKEAITIFKVIERFKNYDLVEFKILTGRTHQIRVHCKYIKNPIYNDPEYGIEKQENGQFLHSKSIIFNDLEGKEISIEIELPYYIKKKLKELRGEKLICQKLVY